jgi:hypothetical protein
MDMFDQGEGCSLQVNSQTAFQEKVFKTVNPRNVIETGTHKARYDYMIKVNVPDIKIHTFCIDERSKLCVDYLNSRFGQYITFHEGNSLDTLTNFKGLESGEKFDLAWIDGGHSTDLAYSDLINCARLGIKNITIDDLDIEGVRIALDLFMSNKFVIDEKTIQYVIREQDVNERRITWLEAKEVTDNKEDK